MLFTLHFLTFILLLTYSFKPKTTARCISLLFFSYLSIQSPKHKRTATALKSPAVAVLFILQPYIKGRFRLQNTDVARAADEFPSDIPLWILLPFHTGIIQVDLPIDPTAPRNGSDLRLQLLVLAVQTDVNVPAAGFDAAVLCVIIALHTAAAAENLQPPAAPLHFPTAPHHRWRFLPSIFLPARRPARCPR